MHLTRVHGDQLAARGLDRSASAPGTLGAFGNQAYAERVVCVPRERPVGLRVDNGDVSAVHRSAEKGSARNTAHLFDTMKRRKRSFALRDRKSVGEGKRE